MQFIQDHGGDVYKMKDHLEWVAAKFLILVCSLVEELQIIQERTTTCRVTRGMNSDLDTPRAADKLCCMDESIFFDKFTVLWISFLVRVTHVAYCFIAF